jgi:hypothetical protein
MRRSVRSLVLILAGLAAAGLAAGLTWPLAGSGAARASDACAPSAAPLRARETAPASAATVPRLEHVVVIVMENRECSQVLGSPAAPYANRLARTYGYAQRSFAITHPSLPNYLALISGSTSGVRSDCTSCTASGPTLVDQLESHGISWRAYMEAMPRPCFTGAWSGRYAKKHNPFVYFPSIVRSRSRCQKIVPLSALDAAIRARRLPAFAFVSPDTCHDGHDCGTATADRFLAGLVPRLLPLLGRNGVVVITWDEGTTSAGCCGVAAGGRVATIVAGPGARRGAAAGTPLTHYSLLATIERSWGLPLLRGARGSADLRALLG